MSMPRWWGHMNKRVFNPIAIRNKKWKILNHVGRTSGKHYRTPLDGWEVDGTFIFVIVYGLKTDWVRNVLESGQATLEAGDEILTLGAPRLISGAEAAPLLGDDVKLPPKFLKIDEYLQMDITSRDRVSANA